MNRFFSFTLHSQIEPLTNVWKRSLMECDIFNSPLEIQIAIHTIQVLSIKSKTKVIKNHL